jgi:transcription initiation factor IIE alpha subunit
MPTKSGWFFAKYDWDDKLMDCSDRIIRETGLSRKELQRVLRILSEEEVISAKEIG